MEDQAVSERRTELRRAVIELRARGLNAPAKWAAEQLTGLPTSDDNHSEPSTSSSSDEEDSDIFLLAKSYFDLKVMLQHINAESAQALSHTDPFLQEYRRVAHVLRSSSGNKARFLRCYALYLAGEKRKEYACCAAVMAVASVFHMHYATGGNCCREKRVENGGPLGKDDVTNKDIDAVEAELSGARQQGSADAFALYLYGLVLVDKYVIWCLTSKITVNKPLHSG